MFKNGSGDPSIAKSKPITVQKQKGFRQNPSELPRVRCQNRLLLMQRRQVLRAVMVVVAGAGRRVPSHSNRSGWIGIHIIWHLPSVYYVSGPIPGTSFNDYYNIDNVAVAIPISDRY